MKKNLVLMLLIAGVLVGLSMMVSAFHCTDTDGGKNYHEKGTGSTSSGPYDTSSAKDGCKDQKTLQEYFCVIPKSSAPSGGPLKWELHPCSSTEKCQNGACVPILSNVSSGTKTIERVSKRIPQGSEEVPKEAKGTPWMDRN